MGFVERLDAVVDRALAEDRIVGTVVIASRDGREIYHRVAGFADREAGTPVGDDTIFRMASVTKPIVAATALALVDKGALRLDAPVTDYLPWFAPRQPDGRQPVITIHHLLTHTAGLTYGGEDFDRAGVSGGLDNTDVSISLEENIRRLATVPLLYEPGTQWAYSMAIDVLGAVIANVENATLGEAVARYVTGPLGMNDTLFGLSDRSRLSIAYANLPRGGTECMRRIHTMLAPWGDEITFHPNRIFNPDAFQSGGGGMAGTAPDFMRFLNALLDDGQPILNKETAATAFVDKTGGLPCSDPSEGFSYFGALIRDPGALGAPWPAGTVRWGGVYGSNWFVDPVNRLALVAYTNTALEGCDGPLRFEIRDAAYPLD